MQGCGGNLKGRHRICFSSGLHLGLEIEHRALTYRESLRDVKSRELWRTWISHLSPLLSKPESGQGWGGGGEHSKRINGDGRQARGKKG